MHSIVASIFLYAATRFAAGEQFVKVKCKDEIVGLFGQQTILDCNLVLSASVSDANIQVLHWKRKEESTPVVAYFHEKKHNLMPGYDFAETSWNNKSLNVGLLISNTAVADDGEFTCFVETDGGNAEGKIRLKVKAKYSPPTIHSIPEEVNQGEDSRLICQSGGGYPKGVLRWFDEDGHNWTPSAKMEGRQTENGLFELSSEFPLLGGSTYFKYTCVLFNASEVRESEVSFDPPHYQLQEGENENKFIKIVAPSIVIGSLIVGLLMVLVLRLRKRAQFARRPSTRPLMNNHHEVPRDEFHVEEGN